MPIRYALLKNEKIVGKDRYIARVHTLGTLDKEAMIKRMTQAGTTLTRTDLVATWELIEQVGRAAMVEGWRVDLPLCSGAVTIQGTYEAYNDQFDPRRHKVVVRLQADATLQRYVRQMARPTRIHADELRPLLLSYYDVFSAQHDRVLSPGRIGRLFGNRLKFDPDDPRQGIFVLGADGSVTRVEELAENRPRSLIFLVPPLPLGSYKLAVRAACSGDRDLDVGFLDGVLRVGPPELLLEAPDESFPSLLQIPE